MWPKKSRLLRPWTFAIALFGIVVISVFVWAWPHQKLNVILVTLDTTRADHVGCYGYEAASTPALDDMAANGVLFENAYTPIPLTLPSHASMLTGLYPPEHGLHANGMGRLASEIPVLAEILKQRHYLTGAFLSAFVLNSKFGLNRGFQTYDDDLSMTTQADSFVSRRRDGRSVMDAALSWLQERKSQPFFCWVHLYDAHAEYDARESQFGDRFVRHPYDAGIAAEDVQLQRLRDFLKNHRLEDQTLVIIAGDHGEGLMQHGEQEHGLLLYQSAVRVPLIVAGPRFVKPGHRVPSAVSLVDVMPTVLDCLSVIKKIPTSGRSLKRSLQGEDLASVPCYAETDVPLEHGWAPLRVLITDRYKYIQTTHDELYDLIDDPGETRNLVQSQKTERDDLAASLEEMLAGFVPRAAGTVHLTPKEQQVLSSLGYTGGKRATAEVASPERLPDVKQMIPVYNMGLEAKGLLAARHTAAAIDKLNAILELAPEYTEARVLLGDALISQRKFSEAAQAFDAVLVIDPDHATAHAHLAGALAAQKRLEEAVTHYRRALKIDSEGASWHFYLAQVLTGLGKFQESKKEYDEAIRCDPGYVNAHLQLGELLTHLGRHKEAIVHFETALKLHPGLIGAHLNLATALAFAKRTPEALVHIQKAVEIDPTNFEARFNLGTMLLIERRFQDAIVQLDEAHRLRPDDPRPRQQLNQAKAALKAKGS